MPDVLNFICGLPDGGQVQITQLLPTVEFQWDGTACFLPRIDLDRPAVPVWVGPAAPAKVRFAHGPMVNYIADPDLCAAALRAASSLARKVDRPWFNHPDRIQATTRDRVSDTLQAVAGIRAPKTIRCKPMDVGDIRRAIADSGIGYPVLIRAVGSQRGETLVRVDSPGDDLLLTACLSSGRELYICPFVDFASPDGLYRKYRVAMIGGEAFCTSLVVAGHWNVHASSRIWNAATIAEEKAAVDGFAAGLGARLKAPLTETWRRLGLDYFGIDFAMTPEGSMLVFEANAAMNILGPSTLEPDIWARSGQAIKAALLDLLDRPDLWAAARRSGGGAGAPAGLTP